MTNTQWCSASNTQNTASNWQKRKISYEIAKLPVFFFSFPTISEMRDASCPLCVIWVVFISIFPGQKRSKVRRNKI